MGLMTLHYAFKEQESPKYQKQPPTELLKATAHCTQGQDPLKPPGTEARRNQYHALP
jgi:hypothetical protein